MKKLTKALALMLVLVMALCAFTACGKSDEELVTETVEGYMEAVKTMEMKKAMGYCGGELYEEMAGSIEQIESELDSEYGTLVKSMMENMEYEIVSVEVDGETATVECTMTAMGQEDDTTFELEKIDGDWKIVSGM